MGTRIEKCKTKGKKIKWKEKDKSYEDDFMKYRYHLKIERYYKYTYKDIDEAIVKGYRNIYFYK